MNLADHVWAIVLIGGPVALVLALAWARLANRKVDRRDPVSEGSSRQLYRELDAEARERDDPPPTPAPPAPPPPVATGEQPSPNLSTEHQRTGDAKRPSDQLDRGQPPAADDGGRKSSLTRDV